MSAAEKIRKEARHAEAQADRYEGKDLYWSARAEALCECLAIVEAEQAVPSDDGWIQWGGGECPVAPGVHVAVKFSNGHIDDEEYADVWDWSHGHDDGGAIVAYRIVEAGDARDDA